MVDSPPGRLYSLPMTKRLDTEKLRALYNDPEQPAEELACLIPDLVDEIDRVRSERDAWELDAHQMSSLRDRWCDRALKAEAKLERVQRVLENPNHTVHRFIDGMAMVDIPAVREALRDPEC